MTDYIKGNVLALRKRTGITQEDLEVAVGVTRQTVMSTEEANYCPRFY